MKEQDRFEKVITGLSKIQAIGDLLIESVEHDSRNWIGALIKELAESCLEECNIILKDGST